MEKDSIPLQRFNNGVLGFPVAEWVEHGFCFFQRQKSFKFINFSTSTDESPTGDLYIVPSAESIVYNAFITIAMSR